MFELSGAKNGVLCNLRSVLEEHEYKNKPNHDYRHWIREFRERGSSQHNNVDFWLGALPPSPPDFGWGGQSSLRPPPPPLLIRLDAEQS